MNLDGTVQALAELIGRPVIVFDAEFAVAAFSVHEGDIDRARLSMILSRKSSERAISMIRTHQVDRARGAVVLPALDDTPPRVIAPLRYKGLITGYASYVPLADDDPAQRDSEPIVELRNRIATLLAARAEALRDGSDRLAQLLGQLLGGDPRDRHEAGDELLRRGHLSAGTEYSIMVFRAIEDEGETAMLAPLLMKRALSMISLFSSLRAVAAVIDDEGVLLIPYHVSLDRMRALLSEHGFAAMRGGGGAPVAQLWQVQESHRQARIALRATLRDPGRYGQAAVWAGLGLDRILLQLPLERFTLSDLPDAVQALVEANRSIDLASTLEAYLDNGADAQRTASKLHIHRSTLYYRLGQMRALVDIDLADGAVRRELHTGLRVAKLAGLL